MKQSDNMDFETRIPVREVMKLHPTTIDGNATTAEAAQVMCRDEVGSCIVLHHNLPIGIVTEEDFNCKIMALDKKPGEVFVRDVMSTPLITIGADASIADAARMMANKRVRRLPVVNGDQKVIGIITVRDILSIATEMNEIMSDLIEINRVQAYNDGICDRCGSMSDELRNFDSQNLCPICREEESIL
ncbi:CBS domain-containing protein [Methanocalculus alkaliphilus]|uniref:CBS domain-containing protein n=1 Tax=Methanocalculus alkaliphilus TaxID=768730 RepID=UPI00209E8238|nr:CBS domain-containing protein [Methanocalculus alkaliphilus]MCP1715568.1 CBS domain-containing protein [Methanocalculus alkaliphilus]